MFDFLNALGRDDVVGLPPVLDLFLVGPRWLAPFYPALVIIGILLVSHLVATKRLPTLKAQLTSKFAGLPIAVTGLGSCIYVLQHHTPTTQGYVWQSWVWHLGAAFFAILTVLLVTLIDFFSIRRFKPGPQVYRCAHFRSPVRIAWYLVASLAIYLGLTVGVAALSNDAAPRWQQYAIVVLGMLWALSLVFNLANEESVVIDKIYPTALFGKVFDRPVKKYDSFDDGVSGRDRTPRYDDTRTDSSLLSFGDPTDYTGHTTAYRGLGAQERSDDALDDNSDFRGRPVSGWPSDSTFGGVATPLPPVAPVRTPVTPAKSPQASGRRYTDIGVGDTTSGGNKQGPSTRKYEKF